MHKVSDIESVNISLKVEGTTVLFVLLANDGTINRIGTGSPQNTENDMFIGITGEPLFQRLLSHLTDDMLKYTGGYDVPDKEGPECRLSIEFMFSDGATDGFGFLYGLHSVGVPRELANFVRSAVEITDPWFKAQKAMVARGEKNAPPRPWWKFW